MSTKTAKILDDIRCIRELIEDANLMSHSAQEVFGRIESFLREKNGAMSTEQNTEDKTVESASASFYAAETQHHLTMIGYLIGQSERMSDEERDAFLFLVNRALESTAKTLGAIHRARAETPKA